MTVINFSKIKIINPALNAENLPLLKPVQTRQALNQILAERRRLIFKALKMRKHFN